MKVRIEYKILNPEYVFYDEKYTLKADEKVLKDMSDTIKYVVLFSGFKDYEITKVTIEKVEE
jgi:hypothetical protein